MLVLALWNLCFVHSLTSCCGLTSWQSELWSSRGSPRASQLAKANWTSPHWKSYASDWGTCFHFLQSLDHGMIQGKGCWVIRCLVASTQALRRVPSSRAFFDLPGKFRLRCFPYGCCLRYWGQTLLQRNQEIVTKCCHCSESYRRARLTQSFHQ